MSIKEVDSKTIVDGGSHVTKALLEEAWNVTSLHRDDGWLGCTLG